MKKYKFKKILNQNLIKFKMIILNQKISFNLNLKIQKNNIKNKLKN